METSVERIGSNIRVVVSETHTFGTDSFLLSDFARLHKTDTALDFCTGCGIVPLLWFRDEPSPQIAYAVDIQPRAIRQLEESVELSGLRGRLIPLRADLRSLKGRLPAGGFDLITCNPPYKARGSGIPSSSEGDLIARHEVLCTLDELCRSAALLLRFGGSLCLCQLPERMADVICAMRDHKIEPKRLRMVQQTPEAAPWLFLVEGKRGAKPFLQVEPPLVMKDEAGGMSGELRRIYRQYGKV